MITYTELVTPIANNLEISTTDTERISRLNIVSNLNLVQLELLNILPKEYLSEAMKTVTFNVTNAQPYYQFPSSYIRFHKLWIDYDNPITAANQGREAYEYDPAQHFRPIDELSRKLYPMVDLQVERGFRISPIPDADVTNGFALRFVYQLPDISTLQPSLLLPRFKGLLIDGTTARSAATDNYRADLAKYHGDLYMNALKALMPQQGENKLKRK